MQIKQEWINDGFVVYTNTTIGTISVRKFYDHRKHENFFVIKNDEIISGTLESLNAAKLYGEQHITEQYLNIYNEVKDALEAETKANLPPVIPALSKVA